MAWLMAYTRKSDAIYYPDGLARSMHLAYSLDGRQYHFLHDNYGLLFAEGKIDSENVILPRGLKSPRLFAEKDGRFAIVAELVRKMGKVFRKMRKVCFSGIQKIFYITVNRFA